MSYEAFNVIGGQVRWPQSPDRHPVTAPATGSTIGDMAWSGDGDVAAAVQAAESAAPAWADMGMDQRRQILRDWRAAIADHQADLALADAVDSGTPIRTMRAGLGKGLDYMDYFSGLWSEVKGETIPATPGNLHYTIREPYGVVGIIIPFNHPGFFALSKTVPALVAGNTVVLKPSELTPISATLIAELSTSILPPGVFNVVQGGPAVGRAIVGDRRIRRLHFTGGLATGLDIQRQAAESGMVKKVSLELGGKNPFIVFPDADPIASADAAVTGMNFTRNQGQSCGSTSRLFVHESLAGPVLERIQERVGEITLGLPESDDTEMGSLVSAPHQQRVLNMIARAQDDGARLIAGGSAPGGALADGAYVEPTVFDSVQPTMPIARQEVFGPVLSVITWSDAQDMLRSVNDSNYGLTAAIYTSDLRTALSTASAVQAGFVWVNGVETRWKSVPFGGYKDSGLGAEHDLSELLGYTTVKSVNVIMR